MKPLKPETLAAQAVDAIDRDIGGPVVPPIQLATTYARDDQYVLHGPMYARDENRLYQTIENVLTRLEGGSGALVFPSGMAAATAAIRAHLRPGDHLIAPRVGYFAVRNWIQRFCARWGVHVDTVDTTSLDAVRAAMRPGKTKLVWFETPANPTWDVTDIAGVCELAHAAGARVGVDSTCASPVVTRPLELGADIVMHSATKYLGGHSDVLAGALITRADDEVWAEIKLIRHDEGPILGPLEAYLLLRGMRTLFVRVEKQCRTALALAQRLEGLCDVLYPGLPSHPHHVVAARQMTGGFGGMLSIRTGGGASRALSVVNRLRLWVPATSLGGVESLVEHRASVEGPNSPTPDDLLRLSVGLEHEDDLFEDLAGALR
ncbi:MAG TPA: aminotransferase class I/II-fold pyridoxal phosphate-dependent enzyme [Kofleriaceae bacterium]|nr:aminotransferase class I/II-fold pyridoxal phosphate-dependent enzyme [Kofleriaceae bacterium]